MSEVTADVMFCDDIRQEVTGKFILIGVYPSDLVPGVLPAVFPIGMFMRVHGLPVGQHNFHLAVAFKDGATVFEQDGEAQITDAALPMILVFSAFPVHVEKNGDLEVKLTVAKRTIIAGKLKIVAPPQVNT